MNWVAGSLLNGAYALRTLAEKLEVMDRVQSGDPPVHLMVESLVRELDGKATFEPFLLHARDACI